MLTCPIDIKHARKVLGLNQQQLARAIGIERHQMINLEKGHTEPNVRLYLAVECLLRRKNAYHDFLLLHKKNEELLKHE